MFKNPFKQRKEDQLLVKIVATLQAQEAMIINDLARQVEDKLRSMSPEEALKAIEQLKR